MKEKVQQVLNRISMLKNYPYPVKFTATEVDGGIRVEGEVTVNVLATGKRGLGLTPEICSSMLPAGDVSDRAIALAAHAALSKAALHEIDECLMLDGKNVVDPHPTV